MISQMLTEIKKNHNGAAIPVVMGKDSAPRVID